MPKSVINDKSQSFSPKLKQRVNNRWTGYYYIGPAMVVLLVTSIIPIFYVLWLSFQNYNLSGPSQFIGFQNYSELLRDSAFLKSVSVTLLYTIGSSIIGLCAAILLAVLLNQNLKGSKLFRILFFIPSVTSEVVTAMMFLWLLDYNFGLFNYITESIGLGKIQWLLDSKLAMLSIILVGAWRGASYNTPLFLSAIENISKDLYEASSLDGAKPYQQFFRITLPMIRPIASYTMVMAFIGSFQMIALVDILTNGGPMDSTTVTLKYIWRQAFEYNNLGYASTISLALLPILFVVTWLQMKVSDKEAQA
jgi:multiple sugar transport system permease protein